MDKQEQIEEMAYELTQYEYSLCERLPKNECLLTSKIHAQVCCDYCKIAEFLINAGYRKIPKGAVVLTREELDKKLEPFRLEIISLSQELVEVSNKYRQSCKETAEQFAERLKEKCKELQAKYSHMCDSKYEAMQETGRYEGVTAVKNSIDEICKEITEGKDDESGVGKT